RARCAAVPLLHRDGAEHRLHGPAGAGPEPGHRRARGVRAAGARLQAQAGRTLQGEELMLRAQQLEITFNPGTPIENRVLRGLSLDIPTGQFVTVIGSNGAGKSTFLNAISGDLMVDKGRLEIDGKDVTRLNAW